MNPEEKMALLIELSTEKAEHQRDIERMHELEQQAALLQQQAQVLNEMLQLSQHEVLQLQHHHAELQQQY